MKLEQKWGYHVFNTSNPAYTSDLWSAFVKKSGIIKKNIPKDVEIDGFSLGMLKRQIFHAMFLEQNPDDVYETVAYNDSEHLDHYNGLSKVYTDFYNSGLPTTGNLTFQEFLKLPNWFADWLTDCWGRYVAKRDNDELERQIQEELERSKGKVDESTQRPPKKTDPWANTY